MKVLLVDDDPAITEAVGDVLANEGYETRIAGSGLAGLALARSWQPDVILLDICMPGGMSGMDALRDLRRRSDVRVIILSGHGADADKVLGLEYADDYVVKPCSSAELLARVRALTRRMGRPAEEDACGILRIGDLEIDLGDCVAMLAGKPLPLTPTEYRILCVLAGQPNHVFSRDFLTARVWGDETFLDPHTLDVHIRGLRQKIEPDPGRPAHVITARTMGFRYVP